MQCSSQVVEKEEINWDVVTGISAGSLNTAGLGMFKIGDEARGIEFLLKTWNSTSSKDVYKKWRLGIAEGFLFKCYL